MSIYATLWTLKFPKHGDDQPFCDWIEVTAQAVPGHIGAPPDYADEDPCADFLPPAMGPEWQEQEEPLRAVVFVTEDTKKGTARCGQEYEDPLLVITGEEYESSSFAELHRRILDCLRGDHPRLIRLDCRDRDDPRLVYSDGSSRPVPPGYRPAPSSSE